MACIAPPPPVIEATILVTIGSPLTAIFTPTAASAPYVKADGDLDFSCFKAPIKVILHISPSPADDGVVFNAGYNRSGAPLTFLDDNAGAGVEHGVVDANHQFPGGISGAGETTISFTYHNDWDGGQGDGVDRYPVSRYGLRFYSNAGGYLGDLDPIVNNGGNRN
jgi:hypothetical protein